MDTQTAPTVSRGRPLAFRIIAGIFGAFVIVSNLGFSLSAFTTENDKIHSFHAGDRMWTWVVGISAMLFGLAGIIFSDDLRYPSSIGTLWGVIVLFVGLVYIAVAEVSSRPEAEAT